MAPPTMPGMGGPPALGKKPTGKDKAPAKKAEKEPDSDKKSDIEQIARDEDFMAWENKAVKRLRYGRSPAVDFKSDNIPKSLKDVVFADLEEAETAKEVRDIFKRWKMVS